MLVQVLKSKLHKASLTDCHLDYDGSLAVDMDLLDAVGIYPGERILVVNQTNGKRLETYAIPAPRGSHTMCLNGAAARKGAPGDIITIMAFAWLTPDEAAGFQPKQALLDGANTIRSMTP